MGYYIDGTLHPWGDPVSLLKFPHLSLVEKLRYGAPDVRLDAAR